MNPASPPQQVRPPERSLADEGPWRAGMRSRTANTDSASSCTAEADTTRGELPRGRERGPCSGPHPRPPASPQPGPEPGARRRRHWRTRRPPLRSRERACNFAPSDQTAVRLVKDAARSRMKFQINQPCPRSQYKAGLRLTKETQCVQPTLSEFVITSPGSHLGLSPRTGGDGGPHSERGATRPRVRGARSRPR